MDIETKITQLAALVAKQQQQIETLTRENQQQRQWLEKLAMVSDLEWSQDAQDWVSKKKLDALRKAPR